MAYETPLTTQPVSEKFQNLMAYTDLSNLAPLSLENTPSKTENNEILTESAVMTENETHIKPQFKYRLNIEEIDLPTSSNEEEKKNFNASN